MSSKNYIVQIIAVLFIVVVLFLNSNVQALYADEPTRALCALEMIINQDWIPTINGEVYVNKPPLYNWLLIPFFLTLGFEEWVVRLPAILSLLTFSWLIFYYNRKITKEFVPAFFTSMAVLTSGNILFYSSLLGHIDALFAIVVYAGFMITYILGSTNRWRELFIVTYILCFLGFMLKGIPAIVFQGITLLIAAWFFKAWKHFFSLKHYLATLWFVLPIAIYLIAFSQEYPLNNFISNLWEESTKRTVIQKSPFESIQHLFYFPLSFLIDTAPWSILILIFFLKDARRIVIQNEFLKFCFFILIGNVIVYWLAPDSRARYVMMLYPLFFTLLFYTFFQLGKTNLVKGFNILFNGIAIVFPIFIIVLYFFFKDIYKMYLSEVIVLAILGLAICIIAIFRRNLAIYNLLFVLITLRLGMDVIMLPERSKSSEGSTEKNEALKIAAICKNEPLSMYCSNLHHSSSFYITLERLKILKIKTDPQQYQKNEFYLIPTELITDKKNTEFYYSFTRRFESKPFVLVKFKNGLPISK